MNYKNHWDKIYANQLVQQLGWYEEDPIHSIELIDQCDLSIHDPILVVGVGASTLIDRLLSRGFQDIRASDISSGALQALKQRLPPSSADRVSWILDDLTHSTRLTTMKGIALWHDRAVLHFFTKPKDQKSYFQLLKSVVRPMGYAIIATFSLSGARWCSGLEIYRYDAKMLEDRMFPEFRLVKFINQVYTMPSGDTREYVYTLFRRKRK